MRLTSGDILWVFLIILIGWWWFNQRPVMRYPSPEAATYEAAPPGEVGYIIGTVEKKRGACMAHPTLADTVLTDSRGGAHIINQRTGVRLGLPVGSHEVRIGFEIPRLAAPGPGTIQMSSTFECWPFTMRQSSPKYQFEVLGNG